MMPKIAAPEQKATAAEQEASELVCKRLKSVNRMIAQGKSRTEIIETLVLGDDEATEWLVNVK